MVNAFREVRLTNTNLKVSGADSRLYVGANTTVFQSETGVFALAANTGGFVSNGQTGNFVDRGQSGQFATATSVTALQNWSGISTGLYYPYASNPAGYLTSAGSATSLSVTGLAISGAISLTGLGSTVVTKSGQTIYVNTDLSSYATAANLATANANIASTGANLQSQITADVANLAADIINLASTGSNLQGQVNTLTTNLASSGNTFAVYTGKFQSFSGSLTPTGADSYFISFPLNFASVPRIAASIEVTGSILYMMNVQNKTISGFTALISDLIAESGVSVLGMATIN